MSVRNGLEDFFAKPLPEFHYTLLVTFDAARKFVPKFSSRYLNFSSKRGVGWYAYTSRISPTGVLGDPTKANREKGKRMWDLMIKNLVEFVEDLKGMSLDELYHRRY